MTPGLVFTVIAAYFLVLILISYFTSRGATTDTFFTANRQSPWFLVAFGMIGASLSGVTFISVPGEVGVSQFSYFQVVLGYLVGYFVIAAILMPLYYRLNLITIYTYLEQRFGFWAYKTGSFYFILSRVVGCAFRLFLVAGVLQLILFDAFNIPFWVTVMVTIILIYIYTHKGGIKTIVWTDTLQTFFLLTAVILSVYLIATELNLGLGELAGVVKESGYSQIFFWKGETANNFFKQFISGAFIAIVMTGLDQDMMQKNLTCRNLKDAQKNIFWFSIILVFANLLFLSLGALLYLYAAEKNIPLPANTDDLYPMLAVNEFPIFVGIVFILGIIAAAYSSADSALTALTTTFCVDFLDFDKKERSEEERKSTRMTVQVGFSLLIFLMILLFNAINDRSVITAVFIAAGYTYGPLLGLFSFGLLTRLQVRDNLVLPVCLASPIISYLIDANSELLLGGHKLGFFILIVNGVITFLGLMLISTGKKIEKSAKEKPVVSV